MCCWFISPVTIWPTKCLRQTKIYSTKRVSRQCPHSKETDFRGNQPIVWIGRDTQQFSDCLNYVELDIDSSTKNWQTQANDISSRGVCHWRMMAIFSHRLWCWLESSLIYRSHQISRCFKACSCCTTLYVHRQSSRHQSILINAVGNGQIGWVTVVQNCWQETEIQWQYTPAGSECDVLTERRRSLQTNQVTVNISFRSSVKHFFLK